MLGAAALLCSRVLRGRRHHVSYSALQAGFRDSGLQCCAGPQWSLHEVSRAFASLPEHTELQMPALSPTMSQGNIESWQVKEGEQVSAGSILGVIETDKATLEWENQDDGYIAKILVEAGTRDIKVGTALAILVEEEENIASFKDYTPGSGNASSPASEPASEASASKNANKKEDKTEENNTETEVESSGRKADGLHRLGPAARRLLEESGLSESAVKGTGPLGIVTKGDVLAAMARGDQPAKKSKQDTKPAESAKPSKSEQASTSKPEKPKEQETTAGSGTPAQGDKFSDVPNSQIRKIIARRLLESKTTVPHYYLSATADLDAVIKLRQSMKAQGTKVSVNDLVIRAVALALAEVPEANAGWDSAKEEPQLRDSVDVAVAVATDKGLITPIVKAANTKSLKQISEEVRELAGRARANKLKPEEFQGGSFSISNLGMFGTDHFSAIINPPQAGILAVGGTQEVVVLVGGKPVAKSQMKVTLSADQRVYDGATSSKFIQAFCDNMANPVKLLV